MDLSTFYERLQNDGPEALAELFVARVQQQNDVGPILDIRVDKSPSNIFTERAERDAGFRARLEEALSSILNGRNSRATDPDTRMVPRSSEPTPNEVTHQVCRMIHALKLTGTWEALLGWLERHWPSRTTERAKEDYEHVLYALTNFQPRPNERLLAFWQRAWREAPGSLKLRSFTGLRLQSPEAAAELLPTLRQEIVRMIAYGSSASISGCIEGLLCGFWNQEDGRDVLWTTIVKGLATHEAWAIEAFKAL